MNSAWDRKQNYFCGDASLFSNLNKTDLALNYTHEEQFLLLLKVKA